MTSRYSIKRRAGQLCLVLALTLVTMFPGVVPLTRAAAVPTRPGSAPTTPAPLYLPLVARGSYWASPFGFETGAHLSVNTALLKQAEGLNGRPTRLNGRISWRDLQPNEGDPIAWSQLAQFEDDLRTMQAAKLTPVVIVDDYPRWATILPSSCSAIRPDKYAAFAQFMQALVVHFSTPEFNVHNWEMGNEPDVDPGLVAVDNLYGCWGDKNDPWYGGRAYGNMLKAVTPTIRAADPLAQVWTGGLLLITPEDPLAYSQPPYPPGLFFQGILEAEAAPYFDVVAYHSYPAYSNKIYDYDQVPGSPWYVWGGGTLGKARFLRQVMSRYGVQKPLALNETSLMCSEVVGGVPTTYCDPPDGIFFQMQADFLVRSAVRALSENIHTYVWYTLEGPGWRNTGLLDSATQPRPAYRAYQTLIAQLGAFSFVARADLSDQIEAYLFRNPNSYVYVAWNKNAQAQPVSFPTARFDQAFTWDGNPLPTTVTGTETQIEVGFEPVYVRLHY